MIVAFAILGTIVTLIDGRAGRILYSGDWRGFVRWYLPGLSLLQVGGSFVELTSSVAVAIVAAYLVSRLPTSPARREQQQNVPELAPAQAPAPAPART